MTKETAKDIAIALIAKSAETFDQCAFEDTYYLIDDSERDKILSELKKITYKMIIKIEKKYNTKLPFSTNGIIEAIVWE